MYAKAHPFGYTPVKKKEREDHFGMTLKKIQPIRMKNGQIRTIYHYAVHALGGLVNQS